jgi:hypothetical protein
MYYTAQYKEYIMLFIIPSRCPITAIRKTIFFPFYKSLSMLYPLGQLFYHILLGYCYILAIYSFVHSFTEFSTLFCILQLNSSVLIPEYFSTAEIGVDGVTKETFPSQGFCNLHLIRNIKFGCLIMLHLKCYNI